MLDIASSVNFLAARSCSFDGVKKQIENHSYEKAQTWAMMARLRENGFLPNTLIATQNGLRPAGTLAAGDSLLTFDHGAQPIQSVHKVEIDPRILPDRKRHLICVPANALGNRHEMLLLPMQEVVVELDEAEERYGDPFVLVPAYLLEGYKGVHKASLDSKITVVMLAFEREEILMGAGGVLHMSCSESGFSSIAAKQVNNEETYPRLPVTELRRMILLASGPLPPAFAESSIDETYAAIEARLA